MILDSDLEAYDVFSTYIVLKTLNYEVDTVCPGKNSGDKLNTLIKSDNKESNSH